MTINTEGLSHKTYDTKDVEALIQAVEKFIETPDDGNLLQGVEESFAALKPKPEMVYVIPEWDEFKKDREFNNPAHRHLAQVIGHSNGAIGQFDYNAIREATRIPADQTKAEKLPDKPDHEDRKLFRLSNCADFFDYLKTKHNV